MTNVSLDGCPIADLIVDPPQSDAPDNQSLRVGLFSESFHPVQNGVATSLATLVTGLRKRRHRVWVFAPENEGKSGPEHGVWRFPSFEGPFNPGYPLAWPFLPRIALEARFRHLKLDIVHTHTPFVMGLTGAKLAMSRSLPLVTTFHTLYSQYAHYMPLLPDSVTQSLLEVYLPWYYNRCAEIICPSRVAKDALRYQGIERPIEVIPTGIPLPPPSQIGESARARTRAKQKISNDTPVLLFAGRLSREKNVGGLLEATALARREFPELILLLAGSGFEEDELKSQSVELGIGDSVRFLGPVPKADMPSLYACADLFCFPSPSETQGLVIGEARAAGLPSVVVNAGGAPETVRDGGDGLLAPAGDASAFAGAISRVLRDPDLRRRLSEAGLRNARDYVPDRMLERVLAVYDRARAEGAPAVADLHDRPAVWETHEQELRGALDGITAGSKKD